MQTADIYKLQSVINLSKARKPADMISLRKVFDIELASLLEQGLITEDQIKEVNFPSWEEMENLRARMRKALLNHS
jgi:hypothetical protein